VLRKKTALILCLLNKDKYILAYAGKKYSSQFERQCCPNILNIKKILKYVPNGIFQRPQLFLMTIGAQRNQIELNKQTTRREMNSTDWHIKRHLNATTHDDSH